MHGARGNAGQFFGMNGFDDGQVAWEDVCSRLGWGEMLPKLWFDRFWRWTSWVLCLTHGATGNAGLDGFATDMLVLLTNEYVDMRLWWRDAALNYLVLVHDVD